ncbi:GNAT family N-acetyltransferase [Breoghania sp. JC706]|uniref:GNAT family N-acetyltransferase n=1 Tax=Breoghania sp. JC706 TaxID=3117732 RepID=UPI00300B486A
MTSSTVPADIIAIDAADIDEEAPLLHLNNAHATELSYLTAPEMRKLVTECCVAARIGAGRAFVLAVGENAQYESPNFRWFQDRFDRFVYIDRVCVDPSERGKGFARRLYAHVFTHARELGAPRVVCEVNAEPPNPASDAFHAALGFEEIGTALLEERGKRVRYFEKRV